MTTERDLKEMVRLPLWTKLFKMQVSEMIWKILNECYENLRECDRFRENLRSSERIWKNLREFETI